MSKVKYERSKPHVDVGTIGNVDHKNAVLTEVVSAVMAMDAGGRVDFENIDKAPEEMACITNNNIMGTGSFYIHQYRLFKK